jgi:hypothetical protein
MRYPLTNGSKNKPLTSTRVEEAETKKSCKTNVREKATPKPKTRQCRREQQFGGDVTASCETEARQHNCSPVAAEWKERRDRREDNKIMSRCSSSMFTVARA